MLPKQTKRLARHNRVKARMDSSKPRLVVYRSLTHIHGQIVDDQAGKTIAAASDLKAKGKGSRVERAAAVGKELAKLALEKKVEAVVFDRAGYKYHGRVKALADGAREGGLKF